MPNPLDFGHLIEGTIEQDPLTDRFSVRTVDAGGKPISVDIGELLAKFVGKEVRFTLASIEALGELAKMVEEGGTGQVMGLHPDQLAIPFNIQRKP
jgi:hypothetical protein